jgi:hypothetical protein
MDGLAKDLYRRTIAVLESVPGHASGYGPALEDAAMPHWLHFPGWLEEAWGGDSSRLSDICWGQYALFHCLRVQDDVLDGQCTKPELILVAQRFFVESLESFQQISQLPDAFWATYRGCVRETIDAILKVRQLEARPGVFTAEDLHLHGCVGAIFRLGTAAVCHLHRNPHELVWLNRLLDGLLIISQLMDDIEDLAGDLEAGRFTWVANVVLGLHPDEAVSTGERTSRLAEALAESDWPDAVLSELRRVARGVAPSVPVTAPKAFHHLVRELLTRADALAQQFHETRVRLVLADVFNQSV